MMEDNKSKLDIRDHPWLDFFFATEYSNSSHDTLVRIRVNAFQKLLHLVRMTQYDVENILNGNATYLIDPENIVIQLGHYIQEDLFRRHHAKNKGHFFETRTVEVMRKIITYARAQLEKEKLKDEELNLICAL